MYNYEPCDKKISIPGSYNKEMDCYFVSRSANNKFRMLEPSEPIQWVNKWLGSSSRNASPERYVYICYLQVCDNWVIFCQFSQIGEEAQSKKCRGKSFSLGCAIVSNRCACR